MRIKILSPTRFFDEILKKEGLNLIGFSKRINENYSSLKKYRRGDLLLPQDAFNKLIDKSPNKEYWLKKCQKMPNNWGQKKGGRKAIDNDREHNRLKHARSFRKIKIVKININKSFCEFYGAMLGDGCITLFKDNRGYNKKAIMITGNKNLDSDYLRYLKKLLEKDYKINIYYYENKKVNTTILRVQNKSFCDQLIGVGFPIGKKYSYLKIPKKLKGLDWKIKRYIIRGLFDTDGSIYSKKSERYRFPIISISSKNEDFLKEIRNMLRKEDYPAYISGKNVSIRGIKATNKWFKDIGSSNPRNFLKYQYFLDKGVLPPNILGL